MQCFGSAAARIDAPRSVSSGPAHDTSLGLGFNAYVSVRAILEGITPGDTVRTMGRSGHWLMKKFSHVRFSGEYDR